MTHSHKINIAKKLQEYIDLHNIPQTTVANRTGVPKEYITAILKGVFTYNAGGDKVGDIPAKHFINLAELLDYKLVKTYWKNRNTPQLTKMISVMNEAREESYTRVLIGDTGLGKTAAINIYKKKHPADVFAITVNDEDTLNSMLKKVCTALKVPPKSQKYQNIRDITLTIKQYKSYGKNPQLIFDEAENLKDSGLRSIKSFYDYLGDDCSIVLVGTQQLIDNIQRLKRKDARGIPQLYRRLKYGIRYLPAINKKFDLFLEGIKDQNIVKYVRSECDNYGNVHDLLVPAMREADRLEVPLTFGLLKKVHDINDTNVFNAL